MKEIKFRIWDKGNKVMYDKALIGNYPETVALVWDEYEGKEDWRHIDPKLCEVMQYTRFKDRNNKEIYEGDIIRYLDSESLKLEGFPDIGEVYWNDENNLFYIAIEIDYDDAWVKEKIEIVGNIYENPELIE